MNGTRSAARLDQRRTYATTTLCVMAMMYALTYATGCAGVATQGDTTGTVSPDTTGRTLVPAGYGSLRQDDLSFHIDAGGLLIRALPLEEAFIRLLTPDSYRALHDLKDSNRRIIADASKRYGGRRLSAWFVSFYGVSPDQRFTPMDVTVTSAGQDYHPYEVVPLTTGFGEQRVRQRETQNALYLYDGDIQLEQPVIVSYQTARDDSWDQTLQRVERERALVRARSGQRDSAR